MTAPITDGAAPEVTVYLNGRRVGTLAGPVNRATPGSFTYDRDVLGDQTAAVSVCLPVRADPYPEHEALPCFENLLPDGDLRDLLAANVHRAATESSVCLACSAGSAPVRCRCGPLARRRPTRQRIARARPAMSAPPSPRRPWRAQWTSHGRAEPTTPVVP